MTVVTPGRPATIVISDWLANCRAGQWTPFEAATALKAQLEKEGYVIAAKPAEEGVREALEQIIQMDDDAKAANGKPGANLNGLGLVDLFDCVGHPFGSGKHKQHPYRSNQLDAALADARAALSTTGKPKP